MLRRMEGLIPGQDKKSEGSSEIALCFDGREDELLIKTRTVKGLGGEIILCFDERMEGFLGRTRRPVSWSRVSAKGMANSEPGTEK